MGTEAVEMIIQIINQKNKDSIDNPKVVIDPWLTIRNSVSRKEAL
jgi:DNA-binding LacI/PurR family transcriptional regulator